jgi:hypothetical protein
METKESDDYKIFLAMVKCFYHLGTLKEKELLTNHIKSVYSKVETRVSREGK